MNKLFAEYFSFKIAVLIFSSKTSLSSSVQWLISSSLHIKHDKHFMQYIYIV